MQKIILAVRNLQKTGISFHLVKREINMRKQGRFVLSQK